MERPPPDIEDTLERMERSQKEKIAAAVRERRPAGPLWARNVRDLVLIVGIILGFAVVSVVARPYLPKNLWLVLYPIGATVVYFVIRSMARKKEPIQLPETTRGK
jgi:hypothetical protein